MFINKTHNSERCDSCEQICQNSADEFYQTEIKIISSLLDKIISIDLIRYLILEYIYHRNGHTISYERKYKGEIYLNQFHVCTRCFQSGIYMSLEKQHRLPFLRIDYVYFTNVTQYCQTNKIATDQIKKKLSNYIFPCYYSCTHYRQKTPELIDGLFNIYYF